MIKQIPLIHLNHTKGSLWWPSKIGFKFGHKSTHITRCALSRIRHLFLNCYITFRITAFKTKLYYFKSFSLPIDLIVLVFKAFLTAFNPTAWWMLGYNPTTSSVTEKAFYLFIYLFIYFEMSLFQFTLSLKPPPGSIICGKLFCMIGLRWLSRNVGAFSIDVPQLEITGRLVYYTIFNKS